MFNINLVLYGVVVLTVKTLKRYLQQPRQYEVNS